MSHSIWKPIIMKSRSKLLIKRMNSVIKDKNKNKKLSSQIINLASVKDIPYHISNPLPVSLISSSQEKKLLHDNIILDMSQSFYWMLLFSSIVLKLCNIVLLRGPPSVSYPTNPISDNSSELRNEIVSIYYTTSGVLQYYRE